MKATKQSGFTLIELMIVIAIIGILAAIAVPQYQTYTNKAKFSEVVSATGPFKTGYELCITDNGFASNAAAGTACDSASPTTNELPASISGATKGYVASVTAGSGVITATSQNINSSSYTYILTGVVQPSGQSNSVTWTKNTASTCVSIGYC
jgi:type IV pilus assembly protein PilA